MTHFTAPLVALALLAACTASQPATRAATPIGPPPLAEPDKDGRCWAREITPAVYDQVMGELQVVQAEIAEDGTVIRPPIYRKAPVARVVTPRGELKFEAPCGYQMTPDFVASTQRALAARGYFSGNVTGEVDAPTTAAIRKFQKERGLESGQMSLETARSLGLVAIDRTNL